MTEKEKVQFQHMFLNCFYSFNIILNNSWTCLHSKCHDKYKKLLGIITAGDRHLTQSQTLQLSPRTIKNPEDDFSTIGFLKFPFDQIAPNIPRNSDKIPPNLFRLSALNFKVTKDPFSEYQKVTFPQNPLFLIIRNSPAKKNSKKSPRQKGHGLIAGQLKSYRRRKQLSSKEVFSVAEEPVARWPIKRIFSRILQTPGSLTQNFPDSPARGGGGHWKRRVPAKFCKTRAGAKKALNTRCRDGPQMGHRRMEDMGIRAPPRNDKKRAEKCRNGAPSSHCSRQLYSIMPHRAAPPPPCVRAPPPPGRGITHCGRSRVAPWICPLPPPQEAFSRIFSSPTCCGGSTGGAAGGGGKGACISRPVTG